MTSISIIGAGLGRTGTTSLKYALEELGYFPCHHMIEIFDDKDHIAHLWKDVYFTRIRSTNCVEEKGHQQALDDLLKEIFKKYSATVDCPGYMFFDKFIQWNPNAKVILTVRDSPKQYRESAQNTFFWGNN